LIASQSDQPASTNTVLQIEPTSIVVTNVPDTPIPPLAPPSPVKELMPPEVLAAQQHAKDNPNDPNAQLDLALAFWSADMPAASYDSVSRMINLVGPDNEPFYLEAGNNFAEIEGWLPAAAIYFQAVKKYGVLGEVPEHLEVPFHEAVYKGSLSKEAAIVLPFDKIAQADQPISLIAQARHSFYLGRIDEAKTFLNQVKTLSPNMPEAFLLEAEFHSQTDKPNEARLILNGLIADLASPAWVRAFAENLLKKLP
jgi:tetratricopeptide (TPR) repeat protein